MGQQLIERVIKQASDKLGIKQEKYRAEVTKEECCDSNTELTESVGTIIGDTIGLVITSVDPLLVDVVKLGKYRSIGTVGGRVGTGPQTWTVDEAIKAINTKITSAESPGDTKGGAGYGSLIYIGIGDVSDTRRAVETALQVPLKYFDDVYGNDAGHLESQYTIRASYCLEKTLDAPAGRVFDMTYAGSAAIGIVLADTIVKAANVGMVGCCSSPSGTSYSNEAIPTSTGDSGVVRQAMRVFIEAGKKTLGALGDELKFTTTSYI